MTDIRITFTDGTLGLYGTQGVFYLLFPLPLEPSSQNREREHVILKGRHGHAQPFSANQQHEARDVTVIIDVAV